MGLGLTEERLWSLTPRQYRALQQQWISYQRAQVDMLAVLRADLHNGWMPRKDGRAWTAQEFGASGKPRRDNVRKMWTQEEFQQRVISQFGPDGRGLQDAGKPGSALATLRGKGQPIPA